MPEHHKSLLFVSDLSPNTLISSSVVFHRHLCRLEEEGWTINLLLHGGDAPNYRGRDTWRTHFLAGRHWWYPPFRPFGVLAHLRYHILAEESASFMKQTSPRVIVGYLRGAYFSGFAAHLARKHRLPLGYFYHDDTELFPDMYRNADNRKRFRHFKDRLIQQASILWAVSETMFPEDGGAGKMRLLHSMAERVTIASWPEWRPELQSRPILFHAGTVYNEIVEPLIQIAKALRALNGQLHLLTPSSANAERVASASPQSVLVRHLYPTASDACEQIAKQATALLVAYPRSVEDMPWIKSCFPSKFVQFTATGLPSFLFCPPGSALRSWVESRDYPGLLEGDSVQMLQTNLAHLLHRESWQRCAEHSRRLWQTEFNPDRIHRQLTEDLEHLVER